jgi:protease I
MALVGKRAVVLVEDLYEELEAWCPIVRLREEGVDVTIAGTGSKCYKGLHGYPIDVDATAAELDAADFDLVLIPGGYAPDVLRNDEGVRKFVRDAHDQGKIVAAICHGPWVLVSAGVAQSRTMTSLERIRDDVVNSGAEWVDEEVVADGKLITSRTPDDLPAFCGALVAALSDERVKPSALREKATVG